MHFQLYRQTCAIEFRFEPADSTPKPPAGQRHFAVITPGRECPGIAKAFTAILTPAPGTASHIRHRQIPLSPFGRPSRFASRTGFPFGAKQFFPFAPVIVTQPHPNKMEKLMQQNAFAFTRVPLQVEIQNDQTLPYKRSGVRGIARRIPEIRAKADLNWPSVK
jgi:hypothetical protein